MNESEALYTAYFRDVFLYLKSLACSDDVAEELTQDTFFKAMKTTASYRGDCDVRVWLCQIAKHTFFSWRKKQARSVGEAPLAAMPDSAESIETRLCDATQAQRLYALLHALDEPYKEVFSLRVLGELPFKQIAAIFGKTESWARVTYHRAKLKLSEQMEREESE